MWVLKLKQANGNRDFTGSDGGIYSAAAAGQPKLTHKEMYDMVNALTHRKPVRIDENDNIFLMKTNLASHKGFSKHSEMQKFSKKQAVHINDVWK